MRLLHILMIIETVLIFVYLFFDFSTEKTATLTTILGFGAIGIFYCWMADE